MKTSNVSINKVEESRKELVDKLIQLMKQGTIPWRDGIVGNHNAISGKNYRGINALVLLIEKINKGYKDPRWATFLQANNMGWRVKAGEKSVPIEKFYLFDKKTNKEFDKKTIAEMSQIEKDAYLSANIKPRIHLFRVFNGEQLEGIPEYIAAAQGARCPQIEELIRSSDCPIRYEGKEAFYSPKEDCITVPEATSYKSLDKFYSTVLHEMAHSSGHPSRMNRDLSGSFGSALYAKEELCAELTSYFIQNDVAEHVGMANQENAAAYLQSWLTVLEDDYTQLFKITTLANQATNHICSKLQDKKDSIIENTMETE